MDPSDLPLRDIHLPGEVSWWPLAIGWWVLIVLAVFLLLWLLFQWRQRQKNPLRHLKKTLTNIESDFRAHGDGQVLAKNLSRFVRLTALRVEPRNRVASLTGDKWLQALKRMSDKRGGAIDWESRPGRELVTAAYVPQDPSDPEGLLQLVKEWFKTLHKKRVKPA